MPQVTVTVEGVQEALSKAMQHNEDIKDEVKDAVGSTAKAVRATARGGVRVRSRKLKGSISIKDTSKRIGQEKGMGKTVHTRSKKGGHHGHLVEKGTGVRIQHSTGRSVGSMPASPFMKPAEAAHEGEFESKLRRIAEKHRVI